MAIKHIFIDMDGVLTDFHSAVLRVHDRSALIGDWPCGNHDIKGVLGLNSHGDFWKKIHDQGSDFWESLEPYPWFDDLIELVRNIAPFTVLTSPSLAPSCSEGKVRWLYKHFPKVKGRSFRDFLIGTQKHLLAQPGHLLIDDTESMVEAFRSAGGQSILFPQIWNRNHDVDDPIEYVKAEL